MTARFGADLQEEEIQTIYDDLRVERDALEKLIPILENGGMLAEIVGLEERTRPLTQDSVPEEEAEEEEMEVIEGLGLSGADVEMS